MPSFLDFRLLLDKYAELLPSSRRRRSKSTARCFFGCRTKSRAGTQTSRHTLAAELISAGTWIAHVTAILGNTPIVVENVYAQHIEQRQSAIDEAVEAIWK
jgi:hypothetical protein